MAPRVLLVKPPEASRFNFGTFSLAVLAAAVRDIAEVEILDATRLGLAEAAQRIAERTPRWVGITTMALSSLPPAAELVRRLRGAVPDAHLVVGGHGATMLPRIPLEAGAHTVVLGEGEITFRRLLQDERSTDLAGLARLSGGELLQGPAAPQVAPLDALNTPAHDLVPEPEDGVHLLETSRGCPHDCSFCETTRFHGRRWRYHTPARVAAEVRHLVRDLGAWIIEITDDNFAASRRRVLEITRLLRREDLPVFFMLSARADDLLAHPGLLPAMAGARMLRISVGVESLDPGLAVRAGKSLAVGDYARLFGRMRELGMFSVASYIVGLPGETARARRKAVELAVAAGSDAAQFLPLYPFPGLPLPAGNDSYDPDPAAAADAERFTREFYAHPAVIARLTRAASGGGVRALLAGGTLAKHPPPTACSAK